MPATVVDGTAGSRKTGICERANRTPNGPVLTFFGVEDVGPTDRTKPEPELCPLVSGADELSGRTEDLVGCSKSCESREHNAGSLLARKAMANAYAQRFTFNLDAQLPAKT